MTTYSVNAPHFCAGLIVDGDMVVQSAPILSWAVGRDFVFVRNYCERRGWTISPVLEAEHPTWLEVSGEAYELHWRDNSLVRITRHSNGMQLDLTFDDLPPSLQSLIE